MSDIPTIDPHVVIEEQRRGYVRYRNLDGRRWEVHGICDKRGNCLIGSVIDGVVVRNHAHLEEIAKIKPGRVDSALDVPVTPEFKGCCPFTYVELPPT